MKFCLKHYVSYLLELKEFIPIIPSNFFCKRMNDVDLKGLKGTFWVRSAKDTSSAMEWEPRIFKSLVKHPHFSINQQPFTALLKYSYLFLINSVTIPNFRTSQGLWMCQVPVTLTIQDLSQQVFKLYWNIVGAWCTCVKTPESSRSW